MGLGERNDGSEHNRPSFRYRYFSIWNRGADLREQF